MTQALQIRRGLKSTLPAIAALGEPLVTTDTRELYIGTGTGTYKVSDVIFSATEPAVVADKIWINTATNAIARASDDGLTWVAIAGESDAGAVTADFQVYGVSQGIYTDGQVISAGTSLEDVVKNMLQAIIPPTYVSPTLSITGSGVLTVEAGTTITPTITPTFTQRDGGAATLYTILKNSATLASGPATVPYVEDPFVLGDTTVAYQATEAYDQGPIKNDNQGNPYPTGRIAAGTATSNTVTYSGKRRLFFGGSSLLGPVNGTTFTINIAAGTTSVVIAYPATLRDLTSVKYVELGNGEVKDTFTLTLEDREGANGFTAISYKVYTYTPAIPFGDAVTYQGVI